VLKSNFEIKELDLSWNQIEKVEELNSLSKLEVLNISYNSLLHLKNMTGLLKLKVNGHVLSGTQMAVPFLAKILCRKRTISIGQGNQRSSIPQKLQK
jgi:hypothetical protein